MFKYYVILLSIILSGCLAKEPRPHAAVCSIDASKFNDVYGYCHETDTELEYKESIYEMDRFICMKPDDFNTINNWYLRKCKQ